MPTDDHILLFQYNINYYETDKLHRCVYCTVMNVLAYIIKKLKSIKVYSITYYDLKQKGESIFLSFSYRWKKIKDIYCNYYGIGGIVSRSCWKETRYNVDELRVLYGFIPRLWPWKHKTTVTVRWCVLWHSVRGLAIRQLAIRQLARAHPTQLKSEVCEVTTYSKPKEGRSGELASTVHTTRVDIDIIVRLDKNTRLNPPPRQQHTRTTELHQLISQSL